MIARHTLHAILLALGLSTSARAQLADSRDVHDRIVAAMARSARLQAETDTFVTWTARGPVLFHLVSRWTDSVRTSLQRNDPLTGVATVRFRLGTVSSASIAWSSSAGAPRSIQITTEASTLVIRDSLEVRTPIPAGLWAIADFGMDDLLVSALSHLPAETPTPVYVYRPYGRRWETLTAHLRADGPYRVIETWAPSDTTTFVVTPDGQVLLIERTRDPEGQRRPLEGSRAYDAYRKLLSNQRP